MCGAVPPRVISGFHGDIRLESASGARGSLTGSVRGSLSGIVLGSLSGIALGFSRGFARRLLSSTAGERGFARFLSLL